MVRYQDNALVIPDLQEASDAEQIRNSREQPSPLQLHGIYASFRMLDLSPYG